MSSEDQQQQKAKKTRPSSAAATSANVEDNPVFNLDRSTQANLLSEALLREFMHKRKFLQTLKQFDIENPRNEMTITSRAVMQEMMAMQKVMTEMKSHGIDSIVEAVCEHRIEKKSHLDADNSKQAQVGELENEMKALSATIQRKKIEIERMKKESDDILKRARDVSNENEEALKHQQHPKKSSVKNSEEKEGASKAEKKKKKDSNSKKDDGVVKKKKKKEALTSIDDLLEDNEDHLAMAAKKAGEIQQEQQAQESISRRRSILGNNNEGEDNNNNEGDNSAFAESQRRSGSREHDEPETARNPPSTAPPATSRNTTASNNIIGVPVVSTNNNNNNKINNKNHRTKKVKNAAGDDLSVASDESDQDDSASSSSSSEDDYAAGLRAIREANRKLSRSNSLSADGSLPRRRSWNVASNQNQNSNNNSAGDDSSSSHGGSPDYKSSQGNHHHQHQHHQGSNNTSNQRGGFGDSMSSNNSHESPAGQQPPPPSNPSQQQQDSQAERDDLVGTNLASSLVALMVGKHKKIPGSFFQPIVFTRVGSRPYGLVQRMGGPCGAIAALQARIISQWFFGSAAVALKNHPNPSKKVLSALNFAMNSIFDDILTVRSLPDEPAVFVIPPPSKDTPYDTFQKQVAALSNCVLLEERESCYPSELLTEAWTTSPWGLVCFILSCILTRTRGQGTSSSPAEAIYSHMDEPRPLIVEHGYCSQEMVNLILCGWATSNVHDGVVHLGEGGSTGGIALRGLYSVSGSNKPLEVGYLSMMEVRKMFTVGSLGKNPRTPVWIIFNESHFTVLFGKDEEFYRNTQKQQDQEPFDLFYYDPQSEEEEYRLTVTPSSLILPAARANALISYVDRIIRTRSGWENARINWNGADPLL